MIDNNNSLACIRGSAEYGGKCSCKILLLLLLLDRNPRQDDKSPAVGWTEIINGFSSIHSLCIGCIWMEDVEILVVLGEWCWISGIQKVNCSVQHLDRGGGHPLF